MGIKHTQTAVITSIVITEQCKVWSPPKLLPSEEVAVHSSCWVWGLSHLPSSAVPLVPLTTIVNMLKLQYQWQHPAVAWLQQRACPDFYVVSIETATVHELAVNPQYSYPNKILHKTKTSMWPYSHSSKQSCLKINLPSFTAFCYSRTYFSLRMGQSVKTTALFTEQRALQIIEVRTLIQYILKITSI